MSFQVPEYLRVTSGRMASDSSYGNNGVFQLAGVTPPLNIIASDGQGWEHVSVSIETRTPTWDEMCLIKRLFWDDEDLVIQFHPPAKEYINCHPHCLHMWRSAKGNDFCETPPTILVGFALKKEGKSNGTP